MALSHIYSLDSVPVAISQIEDYSSEGYYQFVTSSDTSSFSPPGELRLGSPIDPPDGTSLPPPSPLPTRRRESPVQQRGHSVLNLVLPRMQ